MIRHINGLSFIVTGKKNHIEIGLEVGKLYFRSYENTDKRDKWWDGVETGGVCFRLVIYKTGEITKYYPIYWFMIALTLAGIHTKIGHYDLIKGKIKWNKKTKTDIVNPIS